MELNHPTSPPATAPVMGIHEYPVRFTASGSEYFRIWIVNLLLIILTLGFYMPWAKVRKLKYFYSNTVVDGHALDFHGKASQMLLGMVVVWIFLMAYSIAAEISGWAGVLAALVFVGVWPNLFRSAMRFRLANTSWRGLRMRFSGDVPGARMAIAPPLALAVLPFALAAAIVDPTPAGGAKASVAVGIMIVVVMLAFLAAFPYFLWRIKSYQHNNYCWGPLRTEFRSGAAPFYAVVVKTAGVAALGVLCVVVAIFALKSGSGFGASALLGMLPLALALLLFLTIVPRAYVQSRMQNLVWSLTGTSQFRFRSNLAFGSFAWVQLKNYLLIVVTLGLFWPFAVVANKRVQLEAITLSSSTDLDSLDAVATDTQVGAAGDAAADLFGMDVGM